jgi:thiol peroxidase
MAEVKLKGNLIHTNGNLPALGHVAPEFKLVDGDLKERTLSEFKGKRKILSIVPSLDTATCSLSTKKFNASAAKLPNAVVLVVSADLPFAQKRVCGAEGYSTIIPLSMMRDKKFAQDYGVLITDGPLAGICSRAVLVLDDQNRVLYTELVSEITHEPNYDLALKALLT